MSFSFLTLAEFKSLSAIPSADIDLVEADTPGFTVAQLSVYSAKIASRLRKRYADLVPPYPDVVRGWLALIVDPIVYRKRGTNPSDPSIVQFDKDREVAETELKEAADSETGLFDLPLRQDTTTSGISRGGPFGYAEQSPYTAFTQQARDGKAEDQNQ